MVFQSRINIPSLRLRLEISSKKMFMKTATQLILMELFPE
jgi:hypothetical protein